MASRLADPAARQENHQRGGSVPMGKQKGATGAEGKTRRALEDIGNLVNLPIVEGKVQPQINRPTTRRLSAQLLANAQAPADADKKKPVAIVVDELAVRQKRVAKKVITKPKTEEVIEISSEEEEVSNEHSSYYTATSCSKPSRKKVYTLTSVLTARSKNACGPSGKPNESDYGIDAAEAGNQLAVVEYIEDIYKFYKSSENSCRPHDYMDSQIEINAKMRAILADWLIEVHHRFELMPETLYLTFYIIDRYLSMNMIAKRELQLVGLSAMLIASKYEEIWAPEVSDFICISNWAYTREQILATEKGILNKLEWNLTVPTPYMFLVRFVKAAKCDKEMENMVFFFAELGLMQYSMIMYCPSMVAASSVYAAHCTLKKNPLWSEALMRHTGFCEDQLLNCMQILVCSHAAAPKSNLKAIYKKYSSKQFGAVALRPPATKVVEELKALRK